MESAQGTVTQLTNSVDFTVLQNKMFYIMMQGRFN